MTNIDIFKKIQQARKQGYTDGINFTIRNYSAVMLLCLKDKFDFTNEQLKEITIHVNETFNCVCEGYLSLNDISKTLKEENDLEIRFNGKAVSDE